MVDMNQPMDSETECALAKIGDGIIDATIVYKDDQSSIETAIAVGLSEVDCPDEDIFYYCENINDLRSLLKGAAGWENNNSDFYITAFSNGEVHWEAK